MEDNKEVAVEEKKVDLSKLPLQVVRTVAPIPGDLLRRSFVENILFVIDYEGSRFKDKVFLTYLCNLNIKVRIDLPNQASALELFKAYLHLPAIANIEEMNEIAANVMLAFQGKPHRLSFDPAGFIEANREILEVWNRRLCQLPVFALYCRGGELKQMAMDYPLDEDNSMVGVNYVKLIGHPDFCFLVEGIEEKDKTFNPVLFEKFFFKGANLFHFFANPNNPLFMAVLMTGSQMREAIEVGNQELAELQAQLKEISNVPSV